MSEITSGVDVLRQTLYARLAKGALPLIASNLPVGIAALENFARGQGSLSPEILGLLTKELFGGAIELNPATGLLRSRTGSQPNPAAFARRRFRRWA